MLLRVFWLVRSPHARLLRAPREPACASSRDDAAVSSAGAPADAPCPGRARDSASSSAAGSGLNTSGSLAHTLRAAMHQSATQIRQQASVKQE